jgi:glycosyltransferase involved in cell wall biosynthesis
VGEQPTSNSTTPVDSAGSWGQGMERRTGSSYLPEDPPPVLIATILRAEGITGVHTHFRQLRQYVRGRGRDAAVVTPFSWNHALAVPVFAPRIILARLSGTADVAWYRYWHELFLRQALRSRLARLGPCVIYAQCPLSARAALRVRQGPHQRVVMAVHFSTSQADEWVVKTLIEADSALFRAIRRAEQETIPQVDGIVYVSRWARDRLLEWLPAASAVPSAVIENFVAPIPAAVGHEPVGDLVTIGGLLPAKNHAYLLDILALAKAKGRRLTLDIFGEGPLRSDLQRQVESHGLEDQVRLRGFRTDVRSLLPCYRAYVHASYSESSSLAIIEAMAAGLPIVAGGIGPIAEICDDGVEARFWALDDAPAAANVLLGLLEDEPARRAAARAAQQRFHRDFDADVIGPRLWSFLTTESSPSGDTGTPPVDQPGRVRTA